MNNIKYRIGNDPLAVANYIVKLDNKNDLPITNLQLQKVLFFLKGYSLSKQQLELNAGNFTKWKYGPVEKDVYGAFKLNRAFPIKKPATVVEATPSTINSYEPFLDLSLIPDLTEFEQLTQKLTKMPADQLIKMSRDYPNWEKDKPKVYAGQELKYSQNEIKTCFDNNQAEFGLAENKSIKIDKNTDDLEL